MTGSTSTVLARLSQAEQQLAEIESVEDAVNMIDLAAAVRDMAQRARLGTAAANHAQSIRLKAEARLADMVDDGQETGEIASNRGYGGTAVSTRDAGTKPATLADLGLNSQRVAEARLIRTAIAEQPIDTLTEDRTRADKEVTRAEIIKSGRAIASGIKPGQGDDWYTPRWMFDTLDTHFDMDVCAPADPAHQSCPATRHLTETDDGLTTAWDGTIWCNPPYSDAGPWAAKWAQHGNGLLLTHIPANAAWFVNLAWDLDASIWLQAVEFTRPNGGTYRPGYALQLAAIGDTAVAALERAHGQWPKTGPLTRPSL